MPSVALRVDFVASDSAAVNAISFELASAVPPTGCPATVACTVYAPLTVEVTGIDSAPSSSVTPLAAAPFTVVTSAGSTSSTSAPETGLPSASLATIVAVYVSFTCTGLSGVIVQVDS